MLRKNDLSVNTSQKAEAQRTETQSTETPRRIALKQMAALLGISLSAPALDALATASSASTHTATNKTTTQFLNAEELQITSIIAELIIPSTDTPGAQAAGVHHFINQYLAECISKKEQAEFIAGLKKINIVSQKNYSHSFLHCSNKQQTQMLQAIEKHTLTFNGADNHFFKFFKSLTLLGYYTSEIGATKELAYLAIPGGYKGNFPFAKIGKAWALN